MGSSPESFGSALSEVLSWISKGSDLPAIVRTGPRDHPVRLRFISRPSVSPWLSAQRYHPQGNQDRLLHLIETAEAWLDGGQVEALTALYAARRPIIEDLARADPHGLPGRKLTGAPGARSSAGPR